MKAKAVTAVVLFGTLFSGYTYAAQALTGNDSKYTTYETINAKAVSAIQEQDASLTGNDSVYDSPKFTGTSRTKSYQIKPQAQPASDDSFASTPTGGDSVYNSIN